MARIRSIKPEFCTSLAIADLTDAEQLCFIKLWTYCDDDGRALDDVRLVHAALYPLDCKTHDEIDALLWGLHEHGRIVRYNHSGRDYLQVVNWSEHQKPQHPKASKYPSAEDSDAKPRSRPERAENVHDGSPDAAENPHEASPDVRRIIPLAPEPEGRGEEGSVGEPPGGGADAPANGKSYTKRRAEELAGEGVTIPDSRTAAFRVVLEHDYHRAQPTERLGKSIAVISDYVKAITGEAVTSDGRAHLARLINTYDGLTVFDAMAEAVQWGAGIGTEYVGDEKALTKYVTSVLKAKGAA